MKLDLSCPTCGSEDIMKMGKRAEENKTINVETVETFILAVATIQPPA